MPTGSNECLVGRRMTSLLSESVILVMSLTQSL